MTVILHEVDDNTGELLLRATPPPKPIRLDWIRGVHFELGRMLEQLELLQGKNTLDGYTARCAFASAARMLVADLYVAIRHAELQLEPLTARTAPPIAPTLECARKGCGHAFADHQSPGAECVAIVGTEGSEPLYCSCQRFASTLPQGG